VPIELDGGDGIGRVTKPGLAVAVGGQGVQRQRVAHVVQVNKFIDLRDVRDTLPLHKLNTNGDGKQEPYYIGFFLMGAYQDIMGDLHNLFGRVNEVHVFLDPDEPTGYYVEEIIEGSTIIQCLASVQYDEYELKRRMKVQMDEAIKSDRMKPSEAMRLLDDYERGLKAYTYLNF